MTCGRSTEKWRNVVDLRHLPEGTHSLAPRPGSLARLTFQIGRRGGTCTPRLPDSESGPLQLGFNHMAPGFRIARKFPGKGNEALIPPQRRRTGAEVSVITLDAQARPGVLSLHNDETQAGPSVNELKH